MRESCHWLKVRKRSARWCTSWCARVSLNDNTFTTEPAKQTYRKGGSVMQKLKDTLHKEENISGKAWQALWSCDVLFCSVLVFFTMCCV